jgi:hypothetical protein
MIQAVSLALALLLFGCQRNQTTTDEPAADEPAAHVPAADVAKPVTAEAENAAAAAPAAPRAPQLPVAPDGAWRASPLGRDIERVCNVLTYAGVADKSPNEQLDAILEWLPRNIESEDGRNFLGSIAELQGNAKADALDAGARKVGLTDCPLALLWRK